MQIIFNILQATWDIFLDSAIYIIFGLLISGLLRIFLNPNMIAAHLGIGNIKPVIKAALMGIPLPLCSCGVLPAAVSLKKQGANNGATTAFLISTPESGIDSISISYALLDPILTIFRPLSAFIMAAIAGISANFISKTQTNKTMEIDLTCPVDGCCDGKKCSPEVHRHHHTFIEKILAGVKFAFSDVWYDMVAWFFFGLLLAGCITSLIPQDVLSLYLGGGVQSMVIMALIGVPIYVCATASTPIAAALILKGVSPGAALVFLLSGPATNIMSFTVLLNVLGKRSTIVYLLTIIFVSIGLGVFIDFIYQSFNIAPKAMIGSATELLPVWLKLISALFLLGISVKPLWVYTVNKTNQARQYLSLKTSPQNQNPVQSANDCKTPT